jgi:hypothetical protein
MSGGIEALALRDLPGFEQAGELVETIQQLSFARSIPDVQDLVKTTARKLTGADGATLVLRAGE